LPRIFWFRLCNAESLFAIQAGSILTARVTAKFQSFEPRELLFHPIWDILPSSAMTFRSHAFRGHWFFEFIADALFGEAKPKSRIARAF
jgi:hypothetical protein